MTVLIGAGLVVLWTAGASARPMLTQQAAAKNITVELGVEIAARGEQLRLPVILNAPDKNVRSAGVRVNYPAGKLVFERALPPADAAPDTLDLTATDADSAGKGNTVELRLARKDSNPLADGIVALLVFKVAGDAEPGDVVMKNSARVTLAGSDDQIAAQAKDGLVTILASPPTVISCFFYMH